MFRWIRSIPMVLMVLLSLVACQSTDNGAAALPPPGGPVAFRVAGQAVTIDDFQRRLERDIGEGVAGLLAQGQTREQIEELANQQEVRRSVMDNMIQELLLIRMANQAGIGVDAETIDAAAGAQAPAPAGDEGFTDQTALRVDLVRQQLVLEMIARNTRADMFHARHILVDDEPTADKVLADLAGGASFADLAVQYSNDTGSAEQGGDLGWTPRGDFVPEFEEAAFSAELNTPIKVQSQFGWHVIEVLERELNRPFENFEQLQSSQSGQQHYQQTFLPWYEQLRSAAETSGDLEISPNFDPNSVPLPFPPAP